VNGKLMPLYVYTCPECEVELEELRPAWRADDPLECPVGHGLCVREFRSFSVRSRAAEAPIYGVTPAGGAGPARA
jgi:putative FmdB family regulatory protein